MTLLTDALREGFNGVVKTILPKARKDRFIAAEADVINPISVIYGRPGWVVASPVIVGHQIHSGKTRYDYLEIYHVISEGLSRTPEALKIDGRLAAYSSKYNQEQAEVIGGPVNTALIGTAKIGYGWPDGFPVNHKLDSTEAQYGNAAWPDSFNGLMVCNTVHYTEKTAQHYQGGIPTVEILPNGIALHDPRIAYSAATSWVYKESGLFKSMIGGVNKGWQSTANNRDNLGSLINIPDWGVSRFFPGENDELPAQNELGDSLDNNPALVLLDYLVDNVYGASIDINDISMNHVISMANYCDELAPTYSGGPTQEQLSCNVVLTTDEKVRDNVETILATCRGMIGWVDGQYQFHIPRAGIPVAGDLDSDVIIKRRAFSLGQKSKRLNRVIATYIEPNKGYQENQLVYPPVDSAEDILWRQTEDAGELNESELKLVGCTNAYQAADLCAVHIRESRASITAEYELNLTGLKYTLGDVVRITDPNGAFTNKLFLIKKWQFDFERRVVIIGVREYFDASYDVLIKPVLERDAGILIGVDPLIIPDVTNLVFSPATYNKTVLGQLNWDAPNHSGIISYDVRVIGSTGAAVWSSVVDASLTFVDIPYLVPDTYSIDVRARTGQAVGRYTSTNVSHNVPTASAISGLQLVGGSWSGRDAQLEWLPNESEAFKRYKVEVRTVGGAVLYTEYASTPSFELTHDKNLTAGLSRSHTIAVAAQYEDDSLGSFATLVITNAMPASPTSISTTVLPNDLSVSFDVVNPESDFVGASVEFHKVGQAWDRIDLDEQMRSYSFSDLDSNSNYELRLVSRDAFGDGVYSSIVVINTPAPVSPASFSVEPGVNLVTLKITSQTGYAGCDVWVRNRNSAPGAAMPSWTGADSSVSVSGLASATDYSVYYAPIDKKGIRGAIIHIPFTTTQVVGADLSGLSAWATKVDPIDADWIADKLAGNAIASDKVANLTAAKLTAGIITATIGITSGGSIESSNAGYKTGIGVYDDNGTIYTFMTANDAGDIKAGITADGIFKGKGVELEGQMIITGGSGYANLDDKPTSLSGINSVEGTKLGGIATGADKTKTIIDAGLITTGSVRLSGSSGAIWAGKSGITSTAKGFWAGMVAGVPSLSIGSVNSGLLYDGTNDKTTIKAEVEFIAGSSGYGNLDDKPTNLAGINTSEGTKLGGIASGADKTKTIIDAGLITTGSIILDGTTGSIQAGKTGFTTTGDGFWIGQSGSHGGAFCFGNPNEYLYFRADTGLRLETDDLSIGAGGAASFSGSIAAAGGAFKVDRAGASAVTTPNGTKSAVCAINTGVAGVAGVISYSYWQYGGYFESDRGDGVRGISRLNDGGKFTSSASRTLGKAAVVAESLGGAAHIQMLTSHRYFPVAQNGAFIRGENSGGVDNIFVKIRGAWRYLHWSGGWADGALIT